MKDAYLLLGTDTILLVDGNIPQQVEHGGSLFVSILDFNVPSEVTTLATQSSTPKQNSNVMQNFSPECPSAVVPGWFQTLLWQFQITRWHPSVSI